MARVTLVEKITADGAFCRKCRQVRALLERDGLLGAVDRIVTADARDPASEGMRLAARYGVAHAPFFVVEDARGVRVHTAYFRLRRELLGGVRFGTVGERKGPGSDPILPAERDVWPHSVHRSREMAWGPSRSDPDFSGGERDE